MKFIDALNEVVHNNKIMVRAGQHKGLWYGNWGEDKLLREDILADDWEIE